jgi:hypothetical protein
MKIKKISENARRFAKAQSTVLNWLGINQAKAYGFYVPYRYASQIRARDPMKPIRWLNEKLDRESHKFEELLLSFTEYNERLKDFDFADDKNRQTPRFNNDWFSGLDAAAAYCLVRKLKPSRILEIGSGHSTRFMTQAIRDEGLSTHFHSIDPVPRREIDEICSELTRATVDRVEEKEFLKLGKGDFLFLDGSHIAFPGTDADYLFSEILPQLKDGVIVHIHDILLPYGYPKEWELRRYNEQNVLLAMLAGNRYETLLPNHYLRARHKKTCAKLHAPKFQSAYETSYWLKINGN